ncbi:MULTISPECIES: type I restriction-modification system subunit M [Acinetobacter calcoaceticus/baumannii complex]|uniref:type I restriction-modification system subunit M n=1 Tax=Acinetobacter calcoaceticus/baumannii complex TaxID=909768 RepID=UPI0011A78BA1|nr:MULTISPECIES: type I restriction-modification system subunit M [Acinetobacter calcoaceticus/baumannii complex]MCP9173663.1 type I restriction-modification system subunit M [Acinetobacter baumannii]MDQ8922727.1 type I restriction-modification system subunit M [Acinetobacter baumannii]MDQ8926140.1 type I restriction-modification system subunit M [Acinetobacter baumannii]MDQ8933050.1 type I restriction-modification system subunit M [Acinetobacter baumannii]MDQ9036434.1 type I restriction-modif
MVTQINQDTVNKALWSACDVFRGTVSADTYKDYILTMLFLKYISDVWQDHYDNYKNEYGDEPELIEEMMKNERFVLPRESNFYTLHERRFEPGNGERIDMALHALEEANGTKLKDVGKSVFQDISFNTDKLGEEKQKNTILKDLLEVFAVPELDLKPSRVGSLDVIGNGYEFLIKNFAASGGQKAGEFYTPPEVSDLIAELLDPQKGDSICDPACGSGSLLMKCGRKVVSNHNSKEYALYGQEAIGSTWSLAKMNMFLHGEDNHKIEWGDTIRNPKLLDKNGDLMLFDIVTANPPFSLDKWGYEQAENDKFDRFRRGLPPKTKGDYAFISHMIETLKPVTGRMGVVVPHGVLFRGSSEGKIREKLINENLLDAVIGLPEKLFYGTGIPAAILIFKKQKSDDSVLFIDASREFKSGKNQNNLTEDNIAKIIATYRARKSVDKYAYLATLQEVKDNDYNLNIPRYVDTFEEEAEIDLVAVRAEREQLKTQLAELEEQMEKYLEELEYVIHTEVAQ